jgi:hypothetical protein
MRNLLAVLALAAILGTPSLALAQSKPETKPQEQPAKPELTEDQKATQKYAEKIKDLKKFTGHFINARTKSSSNSLTINSASYSAPKPPLPWVWVPMASKPETPSTPMP